MKKVLFVMMAAAMMVSCGNKTQQTAQNDPMIWMVLNCMSITLTM